MKATITRAGAVQKRTRDVELDAEGNPLNPWIRRDSAGFWYEPPQEVQTLLDFLKPQLLWAPIEQEFRLALMDTDAGIRIYLRPHATVEAWKRALCALAEWKRSS